MKQIVRGLAAVGAIVALSIFVPKGGSDVFTRRADALLNETICGTNNGVRLRVKTGGMATISNGVIEKNRDGQQLELRTTSEREGSVKVSVLEVTTAGGVVNLGERIVRSGIVPKCD